MRKKREAVKKKRWRRWGFSHLHESVEEQEHKEAELAHIWQSGLILSDCVSVSEPLDSALPEETEALLCKLLLLYLTPHETLQSLI